MGASRFHFRAWFPFSQTMLVGGFALTADGVVPTVPKGDEDQPILMQSTGLTDRNGKEIFEGDICTHYIREELTKQRKVIWHDGGFTVEWAESPFFHPLASFAPDKTFEVVGNIYEQPEQYSIIGFNSQGNIEGMFACQDISKLKK